MSHDFSSIHHSPFTLLSERENPRRLSLWRTRVPVIAERFRSRRFRKRSARDKSVLCVFGHRWDFAQLSPAQPGRMTAPNLRTVYRGSCPITQAAIAGGSGRAAGLVRISKTILLPARRGVSRCKAWIPRASSVRYAGKSLLRLHREGDNFQLSRERDPPPSLKRRARINRINGLDG